MTPTAIARGAGAGAVATAAMSVVMVAAQKAGVMGRQPPEHITDAATGGVRFQAFLDELGPNPLSDAQARVVESVEARKAQLVRHALGDLDRWQTQLRALANHLEDLEARAARQVDG